MSRTARPNFSGSTLVLRVIADGRGLAHLAQHLGLGGPIIPSFVPDLANVVSTRHLPESEIYRIVCSQTLRASSRYSRSASFALPTLCLGMTVTSLSPITLGWPSPVNVDTMAASARAEADPGQSGVGISELLRNAKRIVG